MVTSNSWSAIHGVYPGYYLSATTLLSDNARVLITGGTRDPDHAAGCRQAWQYANGSIGQLSPVMTQPRFAHSATTMQDGRVLIAGSGALDTSPDRVAGTAEVYDDGAGQFVATGKLVEPRGWHTATWLPTSGTVLLVGGEDPKLVHSGVIAPRRSAEIYDPGTQRFRKTAGDPQVGRNRHTATLLHDGTVLIVGGYAADARNTAEIYNPLTESFTRLPGPVVGRMDHAATLLHDGRVLIAGGYEYGGVPVQQEELFDPVSRTFSSVPPIMKTAYGLTLSTLPNGKVLAVGGSANRNIASLTIDPSWWVFDPQQGMPTFSQVGTMERVAYHSAVALGSGCVLVVGGVGVVGQFPAGGLLYWPDLATLRIRFHGTGRGTVTGEPGAISCTTSTDVQVAVGIQLSLRAEPELPWLSPAWKRVAPSSGHGGIDHAPYWTKVMVLHSSTFDGWGSGAPFDPTNPIALVVDRNRQLTVSFTEHTTDAPLVPWRPGTPRESSVHG